MIKEEEIIINGHSRNCKYYRDLGYDVIVRKPFLVKVKDLLYGSTNKVTHVCDKCKKENFTEYRFYYEYTKGLTEPYYCLECKPIKANKTYFERTGYDHPSRNPESWIKYKKTIMNDHGVDHYSKTQEYKDKILLIKDNTIIKIKNTYSLKSKEELDIKETNRKNTMTDKYGVDNAFKIELSKNNQKKYFINQAVEKFENSDYSFINIINNQYFFIHKKYNHEFIINKDLLTYRKMMKLCICTLCHPKYISSLEYNIESFLTDYGLKIDQDFIRGDRKILNGLELDFYFPDYNFAIEVNGIYWHSTLFKDKDYHKNKTDRCDELGIKLFHIWEDDLYNKEEIINNTILELLDKLEILDINLCKIDNVLIEDEINFLNNNHLKGYIKSTNRKGLYYNNELVSLMSFIDNELVRFCNKIGYKILSENILLQLFNINNIIYNEDRSVIDLLPIKLGLSLFNRIESSRYIKNINNNIYEYYDCGINNYILYNINI